MNSALVHWGENNTPFSTVYNDRYYCARNGLADAMHVFCEGNRLPKRFRSLDPEKQATFTILETGFGTGLDFCVARQLWLELAPLSWQLHFLSLEKHPLSRPDMILALASWPALDKGPECLLAAWPPETSTTKRFQMTAGNTRLTVLFDDVLPALDAIRTEGLAGEGADAVFLDGFAPARNPEMWTPAVFSGVVRLAKPGTTLATFTCAGTVRRGLAAAGFSVRREPGYGGKRSILTGVLPGE